MKIAVTSQGQDLDAEVDPRFGRARYFLVVDTETGALAVHDNGENLRAARGAGIEAGRAVVELGVGALVTGNVGPTAFATLQAGGVEVYSGATGTVRQAVESFRNRALERTDQLDMHGHWGQPGEGASDAGS